MNRRGIRPPAAAWTAGLLLALAAGLTPATTARALAGQDARGAPTEAAAAARTQIEAAYAKISAAFRRKDVTGVMAFATADFQAKVGPNRTLNRAQAQQNLQQNVDTIRSVREDRYTLGRLVLNGPRAVANVTERFTVEFNDTRGEFGAVGKSHRLAGTTRYRDTWTNGSGGEWRMKRSEILSTRLLLDGRPYRPSRTRPKRG